MRPQHPAQVASKCLFGEGGEELRTTLLFLLLHLLLCRRRFLLFLVFLRFLFCRRLVLRLGLLGGALLLLVLRRLGLLGGLLKNRKDKIDTYSSTNPD